MYQSFEKPLFGFSIFYFDNNFYRETAERAVKVLENNSFLPCKIVRMGRFTRGQFVKYKPEYRNLCVDSYASDDVGSIILETDDSRKATDYCSMSWFLAKPDKELVKRLNELNPNKKWPVRWNILSFHSTYGWMDSQKNNDMLMDILYELIPVLSPFCIKIDDISQSVKLLEKAHEPTFKPDHIQQVYWGNYWGGHLMKQVNLEELRKLPVSQLKETENGVFFTLSDSIFDFNSKQCNSLRKKVWQKVIK